MFGITMGLCRANLYMPTHVFNTADVIGKGHNDIVFTIKNEKNTGYFSEDVIKDIGVQGLSVLKSKEFVEQNQKEVEQKGEELLDFVAYLNALPLKHIKKEELVRLHHTLFVKIQEMFGYFNVSQPCISFAIENEITRHITLAKINADTHYQISTTMLKLDKTTMIEEEEKDLIRIALKIKEDTELLYFFKEEINLVIPRLRKHLLYHDLLLHEKKYAYLASSENFDEFDQKYFIERLKDLVQKSKEELEEEINKKIPNESILKKERQEVVQKYQLSQELVHWFDVARIYSHQRMLIRIYWTHAIHTLGKILRECARHLNISEVDIQYLLKEEMEKGLLKNKKIHQEEIEQRKQFCVYGIFDRQEPFLYTGKKAEEFYEQYLKEEIENLDMVKGMVASRGIKRGKVKVLAYGKNMVQQMEHMQEGDILVTGNTRPDMILALKKASAVVTDEGGICSHAALVSREFGIPCIVGTKNATKIFKDGDYIEVDAEKGIAMKIKDKEG